MDISRFLEYTIPVASNNNKDLVLACKNAKENNLHAVCIKYQAVSAAKELLENTNVKICAAIGKLDQQLSTQEKINIIKQSVQDGANEIEVSINLDFIKKKNYNAVYKEIKELKQAANHIPLRICLEISELNKNQILIICEMCLKANIEHIATSSIYLQGNTTLTAVKIIKKTVRNAIKIKAQGNISEFETAIKFLDTGAEYIGTEIVLKKSCDAIQIKNSKTYREYIKAKKKQEELKQLSIEA